MSEETKDTESAAWFYELEASKGKDNWCCALHKSSDLGEALPLLFPHLPPIFGLHHCCQCGKELEPGVLPTIRWCCFAIVNAFEPPYLEMKDEKGEIQRLKLNYCWNCGKKMEDLRKGATVVDSGKCDCGGKDCG